MVSTYEASYRVSEYDCNSLGELTPFKVIQWMMMTSEKHQAHLGAESIINSHHLVWFVIEQTLEVNRWPKVNDTVVVKTIPHSFNQFFAYRNFEMYDEEGELIVTNKATFGVVNPDSRQIVRITPDMMKSYESEFLRKPPKRTRYPAVIEPYVHYDYQVRYSDIDRNQHVNNAVYFRLVDNVMKYDQHQEYQLKSLKLRYDKETPPDYLVRIKTNWLSGPDGGLIGQHALSADDVLRARAVTTWAPRLNESDGN